MEIRQLYKGLSVCGQLLVEDIGEIKALGFAMVICNRPNGEEISQADCDVIRQAVQAAGMEFMYLPVSPGTSELDTVRAFGDAIEQAGSVLAYCRTGNRCSLLWAQSQLGKLPTQTIVESVNALGFRFEPPPGPSPEVVNKTFDVVVVGGGAGGISAAASLLKRNSGLDIAIIEPCEEHYYQPGWTMVGGGIFTAEQTVRKNASLMPKSTTWIKQRVMEFMPELNQVGLDDGTYLGYRTLVVSPGLKLDWAAIEGLEESLGNNGVTSNYHYRHASYTWEQVKKIRGGKAIFTQPPMPIKCAGAPQKALYLSCSHWERENLLQNLDVHFCNAGGVLFGVEHYVPALQKYIDRYGINLDFQHNLVAVDGAAGKAWFSVADKEERYEVDFDFLHVCPPQLAPDFIRESSLSNDAGWVDVDQHTLQHVKFDNIFSLGDVSSTPNAKTAAAVRQQAPVLAENLLAYVSGKPLQHKYDGYGSCPLTVEHGKIVLAEFGYQGKLLPSLPKWVLNGDNPSRISWFLKKTMLPPIYFHLMLRGREWLATPKP